MTICVGVGIAPPKSLNIFSNVGVTKSSSTTVTPTATMSTTLGYTIAPFTLLFSFSFFSMYCARRLRMVSRIPPISPAATSWT